MKESLAKHCISVYDAMDADSLQLEGYTTYTGSITEVFTRLGISRTFYSKVLFYLEEGGHISRTGNRGGVLLHSRPELETLLLTDVPEAATVPLVRRIEALERQLEVVEFVAQLDRRVTMLESIIKQGEN